MTLQHFWCLLISNFHTHFFFILTLILAFMSACSEKHSLSFSVWIPHFIMTSGSKPSTNIPLRCYPWLTFLINSTLRLDFHIFSASALISLASPPDVYTSSLQIRHTPAYHSFTVFAFASIALYLYSLYSLLCVFLWVGFYYVWGVDWFCRKSVYLWVWVRNYKAKTSFWLMQPFKRQTVAYDYFSCTESQAVLQDECAQPCESQDFSS